ncbi:hypothetical protein N656DRAFT_784400 [Canariomyces notabilis]|uniref:Uncharacterized protein n=1 Tax=Canariomyces notabilis TaxID=2074819 RepID=A0AAN6QHJ9_9PEZI|nr:hypothetical protein N656DRAFT_784400 [Canariomyces arenarius]
MSSHQTSTYGSRVVVIQSSNRPSATYFGSSSSSQSSRYSTSSSSSQNSFSFSMNSSTSSQQIAEGRYRSGPAGAVG